MRTFFYNIGYFFSEAIKTIRNNLLSNLFSVIGTGLILFLFGLVLTGWSVGDQFITMLTKEAEISAYLVESENSDLGAKVVNNIKTMEGVLDAKLIKADEAEGRMRELLGEEAQILELFEDNPFEAFIEIRIDLESMDQVLTRVGELKEISYVRDNREVLTQLQGIISGLRILGLLLVAAVGVTTLIIVSHMIRQGIYNNRDQINTLRLLGAPNGFIGFPFVLVGLLLTIIGGCLAIAILLPLIGGAYSQFSGSLPFIPLPPREELKFNVMFIILVVSFGLGLLGSLFGLSSIRKTDH
jgi:cell division transport system permease protein